MEQERGKTPGSTGEDPGRFGRAKEFVEEKYAAASDAVKDQYSTVREKIDEMDFKAMAEQVRGYVRANPGKALLISVGVGFLIGLLLRRDNED